MHAIGSCAVGCDLTTTTADARRGGSRDADGLLNLAGNF